MPGQSPAVGSIALKRVVPPIASRGEYNAHESTTSWKLYCPMRTTRGEHKAVRDTRVC